MRRSRGSRNDESEETQIDISPLIDVVFILVIFFIVTTVFNKEVGVDVDKAPRVASSQNLARDAVMIAITDNGQIFYGGKNIGLEGVETVITSAQDGGDPLPVIIIGDRNSKYELTTKVIDAATRAGAKSVSLATQK